MIKRTLSALLTALLCLSLGAELIPTAEAAEELHYGAEALVQVATAQKNGTGGKKYANWYHKNNNDDPGQWCAKFVSWCANEAEIPRDVIPKTASCADMQSTMLKKGAQWVTDPQPGDLVFYKKQNGGAFCHVAIVTGHYKDGTVKTIHGNVDDQVYNPMRVDAYRYYSHSYTKKDANGNVVYDKDGDPVKVYVTKKPGKILYLRPNYLLMTPPVIEKGTYRIYSANGPFMEASQLESPAAIRTRLFDHEEPLQVFTIKRLPNGNYTISAANKSSLQVGIYDKKGVQNGSSVNLLGKQDNELMRQWLPEEVGDNQFIFRSAADEDMVITAGNFNMVNMRGSLSMRPYKAGDKSQIWQADKAAKIVIEGPLPEAGKVYTITNKGANKVLDIYGDTGASKNKANVQIYAKSGSNKSQQFKLQDSGEGWYYLIPQSNTKLAVNPYSNKPKAGTNVNVYTRISGDATQGWILEPAGEYFLLRSAYDPDLVLTARGTKNMSNVNLAEYTGADSQLWSFK